ncbi:putative secreted protein (Por secretion system target) [Aquimarina sp. MAR_2010_214]|uniref:T9SS type A sorting domain-containing protein n=1 Tax=Aquimarina sp. MAR_2010_214 TaxID=1250026 RepID=UPI000CB5C023|nr:T9SS type A sorting domain-containing protein [Aquimarina sp. MAR_2010_214]PKV49303.1 putative secreted protein (Por secretion system target) [Aquimarina sp. MAR_2010_214]
MRKSIFLLLLAITTFFVNDCQAQTYNIEISSNYSGNNTCAGNDRGFFFNLRGDNTSITNYTMSDFNSSFVTYNQTFPSVSNFNNFSINMNAYCIIDLSQPGGCNYVNEKFKTASQLILGENLSNFGCYGSAIVSSFKPNLNIQKIGGGGNEVCLGEILKLGAFPFGFPSVAYNWQYSLNGTSWTDTGVVNPQLEKTIQEILGSSPSASTDIYFRLGYNNRAFSPVYTVKYSPCTPVLTSVDPQNTSCPDSPDGWFKLWFNEQVPVGGGYMDLQLLDVSLDPNGVFVAQKFQYSFNASGSVFFYDWKPGDIVPPKKYKIIYQYRNASGDPRGTGGTIPITINASTAVTFNTDHTNPSCTVGQGPTNDGSIIINNVSNGTPPYFYEIDGDSNWVSFTGNSVSIPKGAGTYTIKVRDVNQCPGTSTGNTTVTEIIDPATSGIVIIKTDEVSTTYNGASNGYANATVTGGTPLSNGYYTFSWENSLGANVTGGSGVAQSGPDRYEINLPNLSADTYTLTITDNKGCSTTSDFVINEPPVLRFITTEKNDVSCGDNDQTNNDGIIKATVQGGLPNYQYQLLLRNNTGTFDSYGNPVVLGTTQEFIATGLSGGTYRVQVKDNLQGAGNTNPLLTSGDLQIIQPDPFFIQNIETTEALCIGQASGTITLDIIGGTGVYTISIAKNGDPGFNKVINTIPNNSTDFVINNLSQGVYTLTVQDENGCDIINPILERIITITDPSVLWNIDLGENKMLCMGQSHIVDATIGDPLATYRWESDNGFSATTPEVILSETGLYTVTLITGLGCQINSSIQITATQTSITPEFVVPSDIFVDESFIIVDVSNPSPITVAWIIPDNAEIIESTREYAEIKFTEKGSFDISLQTTNAIGCQESYTKNITIRERIFKEETEGKEKLKTYKIFPNPTRGNFTVELTFKEQIPIDIKLFNVANNNVLYRYQDDSALEYNIPFNLEGNLSSGIYFLLLEIPGKTHVRKIVVE